MENFINTNLLPLEVSDIPWLYENNNESVKSIDTGKWMLFYDKSLMNEAWVLAKKLYRENKLDGVKSMKCSTVYENPRADTLDEGIIILYCNNSSNEETIMNIGKKIIEMFDYKEKQIIYYKTDLQTRDGTIATESKKNHSYKLFNTLYNEKCLIKLQGSNSFLQEENPQKIEETQKIERHYPSKKIEKQYPIRYNAYVFDRFNEMNNNIELQNDYKKWKDGINYNTNRKIKIGGETHTKLKQKFIIYWSGYYFNSIDESYNRSVLFDDLINIDIHNYLQETEIINKNIDIDNISIKEYNNIVNNIIEQINKLLKWNDFVEFEGKCYGITNKVLNNIHRENDCFGSMIFYKEKEHECRGCRDGIAFNGKYNCSCFTYDMYKCNICGFIEDK